MPFSIIKAIKSSLLVTCVHASMKYYKANYLILPYAGWQDLVKSVPHTTELVYSLKLKNITFLEYKFQR